MDPTETDGHFTSKYPIIFKSPFGAGITPGAQTPMQHIELTLGLRNNEPRPVANIPMPVAGPGFPAQLRQQFMNNGPGMQLPDGSNQYVFPGMGPSGPPMHSLDLISMSQAMQAEPMQAEPMQAEAMHPQPVMPQPVMPQPMHPQPGLPTPDSNEINLLNSGEIETEAEMSAVAADPALQQEQQNVPAEAQFGDFDLDDPAFFEFSVDGPAIGNQ
ncbi:hypothetical protein Daus18300_000087 [Diaporthe australafricana]|uniref:Uncharacterized protein n=1 Tax=Diaporthe australafricana TaxID=127596 RepID=A0ABR3Y7I0_9PEZI